MSGHHLLPKGHLNHKINDPIAYVQGQLEQQVFRYMNAYNSSVGNNPLIQARQNRLFFEPNHPAQGPLWIYDTEIEVNWTVEDDHVNILEISPFFEIRRIIDEDVDEDVCNLVCRTTNHDGTVSPIQFMPNCHGNPMDLFLPLNAVIYVWDVPTASAVKSFLRSRVKLIDFIAQQNACLERLMIYIFGLIMNTQISANEGEQMRLQCQALRGHYHQIIDDMVATQTRPEDVRAVLNSAIVIDPIMVGYIDQDDYKFVPAKKQEDPDQEVPYQEGMDG